MPAEVVDFIQGQMQKGQWHCCQAYHSHFPNKYWSFCVYACTNTRTQQACFYTRQTTQGADTCRQWLWLMHQASWHPAVLVICPLITLSVCFIRSWWSLSKGRAPGVPSSPGLPSPNRIHTHTHTHLNHPVLSRLLKICHSWAKLSPELINLHLKDNSGTSHWPYVLCLLDSFPPLGFSIRRWTDGLQCFFIPTTTLLSSSHVGMLNSLCTFKLLGLISSVTYCKIPHNVSYPDKISYFLCFSHRGEI